MNSWFFPREKDRSAQDIDSLWDLCSAEVAYTADMNEETRATLIRSFDAAARRSTAKLTMGIYWARPDHFAAYDSVNRDYLQEEFPELAASLTLKSRINGAQFLDNTEKLSAWLAGPDTPFETFVELSYAAWLHGSSPNESPQDAPITDPGVTELVDQSPSSEPYSVESIREDGSFLSEAELEEILERLKAKKNIILQGPPGTGKTWLARRLGWALCDERESTHVKVVQFHPSLTYEDFVRGWRPTSSATLELTDGPFLEVCAEASKNPTDPYVLVIEEANRGNPAQIFGELLTLMEADKRTPECGMRLAYPREGELFYVPPNLYVIGTMNVADRSLAMVDIALRRRFAFIEMEPCFDEDWAQHVSGLGYELERLETYGQRMRALNDTITEDATLGPQYRIGHSFFTPADKLETTGLSTQEWWRRVVETEIRPLLEEYWFDRKGSVDAAIAKLLGG